MKQIKSMKSYSILASSYPKFKKFEAKMKVSKLVELEKEKLAAEENRSFSSFLLNAILTYIKDHKKITWQIDKDSQK